MDIYDFQDYCLNEYKKASNEYHLAWDNAESEDKLNKLDKIRKDKKTVYLAALNKRQSKFDINAEVYYEKMKKQLLLDDA